MKVSFIGRGDSRFSAILCECSSFACDNQLISRAVLCERSNMTWSKFHKNCIITGLLDGYCLVCEEHMYDEDEYNVHIEKQIHKQKLEATPLFEKYKNEYVMKVKRGYYCTMCNALFSTASKVGLHVAEPGHTRKKGINLLRRIDNNKIVIAFNNILIGDKAWNGFVGDNCVLCDTEFEHTYIHKSGQDHILNLLQKNVEFAEDGSVFRKIDEMSFQCLVCNLEIAAESFFMHFKENIHAERLKSAQVCGELTIKHVEEQSAMKQIESSKEPSINGTVETSKKDTPRNKQINQESKHNEGKEKKYEKQTDEKGDIKNDAVKNAIEMDKYICRVLRAKNFVTNQDGRFSCLLCGWDMKPDVVGVHVNSRHHLNMQKMHYERLERLSNAENTLPRQHPIEAKDQDVLDDTAAEDDKSRILDSLSEFQKNDICVNFEMNVANCKKCSESFKLEFDVLKSHIEKHTEKVKKEARQVPFQSGGNETNRKENGNTSLYTKPVFMKVKEESHSKGSSLSRDDEEIVNFAKKNNLTYDKGEVMCQLCNTSLSCSLKSLKEHVDGAQHKTKTKNTVLAATPYNKANIQKVPIDEFVTSLMSVKDFLLNGMIINEKFHINMLSFLMITPQRGALKCEVCEELLLGLKEAEIHKFTDRHAKKMNKTMVIVSSSLENEFIRELRPDVYHCGFCTEVAEGWDSLMEHVATTSHRESRNSAAWRLREHSAEIMKAKWQEIMERSMLGFMLSQLQRSSSDDEDD